MEEFQKIIPKGQDNSSDVTLNAELPGIPASQNKRFLNFLIDTYIQLFIGLILWYLVFLVFKIKLPLQAILIYIPTSIILYYFIFEGIFNKTPAKYFTDAKVYGKNNNKPGVNSILFRTLFRLIPIDLLSFLFSGNPVGWHDKLSKTFVADEKSMKKNLKSPLSNLSLLVLDFIIFCIIVSITYLTFKYFVINVIPELRYFNNLSGLIAVEISSITQSDLKTKNFNNSTYGISLEYPGSWLKIGELDNPDQPVVLIIKSNEVLFRIHKPETGYENMTSETGYLKEYLDTSSTSKINDDGNVMINHRKFYKFTTTDSAENRLLKILSLITFKNDKVFIFSFAAYNEEFNINLPIAQKIFDSIKIN